MPSLDSNTAYQNYRRAEETRREENAKYIADIQQKKVPKVVTASSFTLGIVTLFMGLTTAIQSPAGSVFIFVMSFLLIGVGVVFRRKSDPDEHPFRVAKSDEEQSVRVLINAISRELKEDGVNIKGVNYDLKRISTDQGTVTIKASIEDNDLHLRMNGEPYTIGKTSDPQGATEVTGEQSS